MKLRLELQIPDETGSLPLQPIQAMDAMDKSGRFAGEHLSLLGRELYLGEHLRGWFTIFSGVRIEYDLYRMP